MHAAYVGRSSYYSSWPVDHNSSMSDRCATTDQSTSTTLDRPLLHGCPQNIAIPGQKLVNGVVGSGFHAETLPDFHLPGSAQMTIGVAATTDVKAIVSSDESFCSSDDQPPSKNSNSVDGFIAPLPLPSYHSRCPSSAVDTGGQSFSPLSTFAGYPFPVLPPSSTSCLVPPPPPPGYRFALETTSRGRIPRQNGVKSSTKLVSQSRQRSHIGSYMSLYYDIDISSLSRAQSVSSLIF